MTATESVWAVIVYLGVSPNEGSSINGLRFLAATPRKGYRPKKGKPVYNMEPNMANTKRLPWIGKCTSTLPYVCLHAFPIPSCPPSHVAMEPDERSLMIIVAYC